MGLKVSKLIDNICGLAKVRKYIDNITCNAVGKNFKDFGMTFYNLFCEYMSDKYEELAPLDFYREIFPVGELQKRDESHNWKYNALAVEFYKTEYGKLRCKKWVCEDDFSKLEDLMESENFIIMAPITYVGKKRTSSAARYMYAMCFDLDGLVDKYHIQDLFQHMDIENIPRPQFIACSGFGLHLYYQFEYPVPLFQNIAKELQTLKQALTKKIWNQYITTLSKKIQYQPIYQGFRIVGGVTKDYAKTGHRVKVWRTNTHPTCIEELNRFVPEESRVKNIQYKPTMTLEQAKEKYPNWYKHVVLKQSNSWTCKRDLYDWWKRQISEKGKEGHRYYCIMCLAIYAKKCGIEYDELLKDALSFVKDFDAMTSRPENHFHKKDVYDALKAYQDEKITFPINSISHFAGVEIPKNKRNGRKQADHLKRARLLRDLNQEEKGTKWNGRKSKKDLVEEYFRLYSNPTVEDCMERLGICRSTVFKYKPKKEK